MQNKSSDVILLNDGRQFNRMQPTEIPQFTFPLLQFFQQQLDNTSGISGVLRGNISDGAQLSAEALTSLQAFASARLKQQAVMLAGGARELGYQLMWMIRQLYTENISFTTQGPDGSDITVDWNQDRVALTKGGSEAQVIEAKEEYLVDIAPGTGVPGAQDEQRANMMAWLKAGVIDAEAVLEWERIPGRQGIIQRKQLREGNLAFDMAAGKSFGVDINKIINPKNSAGATEKI